VIDIFLAKFYSFKPINCEQQLSAHSRGWSLRLQVCVVSSKTTNLPFKSCLFVIYYIIRFIILKVIYYQDIARALRVPLFFRESKFSLFCE